MLCRATRIAKARPRNGSNGAPRNASGACRRLPWRTDPASPESAERRRHEGAGAPGCGSEGREAYRYFFLRAAFFLAAAFLAGAFLADAFFLAAFFAAFEALLARANVVLLPHKGAGRVRVAAAYSKARIPRCGATHPRP